MPKQKSKKLVLKNIRANRPYCVCGSNSFFYKIRQLSMVMNGEKSWTLNNELFKRFGYELILEIESLNVQDSNKHVHSMRSL